MGYKYKLTDPHRVLIVMSSISFPRILSRLSLWLLRILKNIPRELNGALLRLIQTILRLYSAATPLSPSSSSSTRPPLTICASSAPAPVISSQMQGSVPFSTSPLGTGGSDSNGVAIPPPSNQSHADEASPDPPLHSRELAQRDGTTANPSNSTSFTSTMLAWTY